MNGTLAIARRELAERRVVLITAAILAVVPFAVLLIPDVKRLGTDRVVAAGGAFVTLAYVQALALLLGATFVGRELSDRRLSFYFAKPVSGASVWFGKLLGSLATLAIATATILLPSMLVSLHQWDLMWKRGLVLFVLAVVTLFLAAHAISTMFRSRSLLILADLACGAVAAAVLFGVFNALERGQAVTLRFGLAWVLIALLLVFLVAAGAWQLSRGRIDPVRSHRELSRFLWSAVGATLAVLGALVLWIVSVTPDDLGEKVWAAQPPAGKWMMLAGPMENRGDYTAGFYVNLENGAYARADARSIWWATFFTPDGRAAGQLRPLSGRKRKGPMQLDLVRFGGTGVEVTPTEVTFSEYTQPVLDDRATRVVAVTGALVTVQSIPDGRTLAAVRLPRAPQRVRFFFENDSRVRIYGQDAGGLEIYQLDVAARRLDRTGSYPSADRIIFNANADGSRLFVRSARGVSILDGRTGAVLASLPGDGRGAILSDGRIAVVSGKLGKLSIYGPDSALQHEIALPRVRNIPFLREVEGGTLIVGGHQSVVANEPDGRGWTVYAIDLARGAIVRTGRDLQPMSQDFHFGFLQPDPRRTAAAADAPFVFLDRRGGVVLWDATNGSRRAITRAAASLPTLLLTAVLHLQPLEQGVEVLNDCGGFHLPLAR